MTSIVCDMDGTLSNCVHRQHFAERGDWKEFHSLLLDDEPYADVAMFLTLLPKDHEVIIVTGRNETYKEYTWRWLIQHKLCTIVDRIIMRPDNNFEQDHILKPKMLEENIGGKEDVLREVALVLEDRDKVVEAWRNYGLPCWQVRPGGY
jgi:hypothetical protein